MSTPGTGSASTIAAVASAPGQSPRAIVRVSGSAGDFAALFVEPVPTKRGAYPLTLKLGEARLRVLVMVTVAPASYSGEDSLDIVIPGGPAIVARVQRELLSHAGLRQAEPGEFTARAYTNGRLGIEQAKAVAAIIAAENEAELAEVNRVMDAHLGDQASAWSSQVARLLALVEAGIDFADQEDVVAIEPAALVGELDGLLSAVGGHISGKSARESVTSSPRVVLAGRPSSGKSTLFNALLGFRRSVVDAEPGTTRDAIAEPLSLPGGGTIELVDLAGLDEYEAGGLDEQIQERANKEIQRADAVLWCDPSGEFADPLAVTNAIRVRTKADVPITHETSADVEVCALDGWHLDDLRLAVVRACGLAGPSAGGAIAARFDSALRDVEQAMSNARSLASAGRVQWELVAGELRAALDGLGVLAGRIEPDEVLGLIFQTFCIGK